jgi:hypothetical protein
VAALDVGAPPSAPAAPPAPQYWPAQPPQWGYAGPTGSAAPARELIAPTVNDLAVAILAGVMAVSLFLPFYKISVSTVAILPRIGSIGALSQFAGGWRFMGLSAPLVILAYLLIRLLKRGLPSPVAIPHTYVLAGLVTISVAVMFLTFFVLPAAGLVVGRGGVVASYSWAQAWGAFLGLSAGVLALGASLLRR